MSFEPRDYLRHTLIEAEFLCERSAGVSFDSFMEDQTLRRAMAGMRDRLIHDYFGVDYELVWDVVQNRIPELRARLATLLSE